MILDDCLGYPPFWEHPLFSVGFSPAPLSPEATTPFGESYLGRVQGPAGPRTLPKMLGSKWDMNQLWDVNGYYRMLWDVYGMLWEFIEIYGML